MTLVRATMALLLSTSILGCEASDPERVSGLEGPYLGQTPPGMTPDIFAPGIVSTEHYEGGSAFTPDMSAFYFTRFAGSYDNWEFVVFEIEDGRWVQKADNRLLDAVISPEVGAPTISPDGRVLHFGRRYMERTGAGWSELRSLGAPFDDIRIMRLTASSSGTFVLDEMGSAAGDGVLRYSRLVDGQREAPRPFHGDINTGLWTAHPYIAQDGSYVMWDTEREGGYGDSDIYISFQQEDGSWGPALNLGEAVNTGASETGPMVTPDGRYFFFDRYTPVENPDDPDAPPNVEIYWVDARIIETLRPNSGDR